MKRLLSLLALALGFPASHGIAAGRPNILWFVVDDMSANFSCYGEKLIQTPHVDRLAARGHAVHARRSSPRRSVRRAARR